MLQTREFVKSFLKDKILPLLKGPLFVIVHYRIPAPAKITQKKRALQHKWPHAKKPDGDNLEKFLNDALNGIVWADDSQIAWLLRSKSITSSKTGSTTIFVRPLPEYEQDYQTIIDDIREHIDLDEHC
jgi:Holliday junction resolvase RusA-like endonuclease